MVIAGCVEIVTGEELAQDYQELAGHRFLMASLKNIRHCTANLFGECVAGTLFIPHQDNLISPRLRCGFYLDENRLLVIDDEGKAEQLFHEVIGRSEWAGRNEKIGGNEETGGNGLPGGNQEQDASRIFFELLEYLIQDDLVFLETYERTLDSLEDQMDDDRAEFVEHFDGFISRQRRELRRLTMYYKHLAEVADVVEAALTKMEKDLSRQLLAYFRSQVDRLYHDAVGIGEHALQLRDLYLSKINMKENKVMQLLTIVTTIFMPLTLIAGWYGMNFRYMPELAHRYGYIAACVLAAVVVIVEIVWFKRKKWF